ncbi:unnamed protein product [Caenorhabditis nigoni]
MRLVLILWVLAEIMLQNEIMADHRTINRSEFRGNFYRRRNYDGPRAYQIGPDLTCSYDNQCAGYPLAICDSVCKCVKGALNTGTTCIATSTALQSSVACPTGQTYIREAGVCMTVQQPGEPCQYSQQCSALEPGAYCLKMRCECVYGMKKSSNGCTFVNNDCKERGHIFISEIGECREVIPPGGKGCSHNLQCSGAYPDATCFMQTCTCPPNLPVAADGTCGRSCPDKQVYSGVTGECLPEKQPGQDCIYSSQCQAVFGGLVCDKNTCRCPNGLVFDGLKCSQSCSGIKRVIDKEICVEGCPSGLVEVAGRCVKQVSIGQPCSANAQCNFGSFCQSGTCQCPPGFYVMDSQCQAIESDPNGSCQNNEKCTKGSVCYNGKCTCPSNQALVNGYCQQNRAVPIGSACVRVGVTCDGGSVCVAGICVCPLGKTPRNGVCIEQVAARPGTSCRNGEECVEHSYCSEETHKCECIKASQMVIGGECRERLKAHPGYGCTMGEMCVGNSVCINGKCACTDGKVDINKICVEPVSAKPGDTCGKGIVCNGGSYCNTDSGKCACPRGENAINGICKAFTFVYPGDLCTEVTSRCTGGSYCARGRCECPLNMNAVDKKCVLQQIAAPGEHCSESITCTGFSVCKSNRCTCVNEMMIREKMCVQRRKVNIGSSCSMEDQCLGNSTCTDNSCQCPPGHAASLNVCVLRKTVTPGYLCNPEDICTGQSVCIKGVCQCQPDYKQMHNICVKKNIGVEGSPCSNRDDCGEGLTCSSGKCACPDGLFSVNGRCRSYVQMGHTCTSDDRCTDRNALCQENICSCKSGYTNISGQCSANIVQPAEPETLSQVKSTKCLASNQCPSGAQCVKGECKCKPGLAISRYGFCVPITFAEPGTSCAYGERCQKDSHCADGLCTCNEPLILKENKCVRSPREKRFVSDVHRKLLRFTPKKKAKLGEYCYRDDHCESQKQCLKNVCKCGRNFVQSSFSCVPRMSVVSSLALPGESCRKGFCVGGSTCSNFICKCPDDYFKQGDTCVRYESRIGAPCGVSTGCSGGSTCSSSFCQCQDQYDADVDECYPYDPPVRSRNIKGISGRKKVNRVVSASGINCPIGYDLVNGMCVNSETLSVIQLAAPGGACEDGTILCTGNSVCANNVCICPGGETVQNGTCVSINTYSEPGELCDLTNTICTGNSQCIDGICKCPNNQGAINGRCSNMGNVNCGNIQCGTNQICIQNLCQCRPGYYQQPGSCLGDRCNCIQETGISPIDPCNTRQCGMNQMCIQDRCQCRTGYLVLPETCVSDKCNCVQPSIDSIGNGCQNQCGNNQVCIQDQCQCRAGYYAQPETCMGDRCNCIEQYVPDSGSCQRQCGNNQVCIQDQCQCRNGYVAQTESCIADRCNCVQRVVAQPVPCLGTGCSASSSQSLLPYIGLPGQMCDFRPNAVPCRNEASCINNYCACPSNRVISGTECVFYLGDALPGQSCQNSGVICRGGSSCSQSTCQCATGFSPSNGRCAPIVEIRFTMIPVTTARPAIIIELSPGQTCDPQCSFQPCLQRCSGGSSCSNSVCTCPPGNFINNNACTPNFPQNDNSNFTRTARPGENCDNTIVCIGGSSCLFSTCSCDSGYTPSPDRTSCELIGTFNVRSRSYPKSFCSLDSECTGGAICVDKRCACRIDHEMINGICQLANLPGSRCHTSFCSKGADCRNGYCVCAKTNYSNSTLDCATPPANYLSALAYPGSKCTGTTTCQNNTSCVFGYCVIPQDEIDKETPMKKLENNGKKQAARRTQQPRTLTECPRDGSCKLPDCFCTSTGKMPPDNLDPKQVPQMVLLSFDDPITDRIINTLKSLFSGKIRNPNGCAIKGTFFVSHQWNNYDQTLWLHSKGNEIGVNSITKEDLSGRTKERWYKEQKGMRETLAEFSYVDRSQILGTRAPMFKIGGDAQYEMMTENNFTYDNSMLVSGAYWPQTLDHKLPWDCTEKCPTQSHKGIWEIPIQNLQGDDSRWYKTLTRALKPVDSRDSVKKMLMRNFMNHYKTNRAPFVLTLDTEFLTYLPDNGAIYALEDFLKDIVLKQDVFIVTGSQMIDWMRSPYDLNNIKNLRSWQCKFLMNDHVQPCEVPSTCSFDGRSRGLHAHSFRMCGVCPTSYPWIS